MSTSPEELHRYLNEMKTKLLVLETRIGSLIKVAQTIDEEAEKPKKSLTDHHRKIK